jgi:hypothetical protein
MTALKNLAFAFLSMVGMLVAVVLTGPFIPLIAGVATVLAASVLNAKDDRAAGCWEGGLVACCRSIFGAVLSVVVVWAGLMVLSIERIEGRDFGAAVVSITVATAYLLNKSGLLREHGNGRRQASAQ